MSIGFLSLLPSCAEESSMTDLSTEDFLIADARGRGQNGGNGQNGGKGANGLGNEDPNQTIVNAITSTIVIQWSDVFLELDRYATGMRPNATARAIAYINLAAYEVAVPFMDKYRSNSNRLRGLSINANEKGRRAKLIVALNSSYAKVLDHFMINVTSDVKSKIGIAKDVNINILGKNLSPQEIQESKQWGNYVAAQVIAYSRTDRAAEQQIQEPQPLSYEPPTGDGYWTYSADPERALFPYWKSVRTFVISSNETSSTPPISYNSNPESDYYAQMREVYNVNNTAKSEKNDDLWIAEFWSDDVEGLMMSPPGRQVSIAKQLIIQNELNLEQSLVMMLKLGFSLNDAAVSTWDDKYEYMVMRPSVFIHKFIDTGYQTNLYRLIYWPNPSFPGYPSGHSCFASAAAGIFINQFGDNMRFTDRSHEGRTEFRGEARSYNSLSEMAREGAFSRIPLGVHVRMDCTEGYRLGYEISDAVNRLNLENRGPA